jgi:ribosome biogenesis SPOUT family RNA methylase Rps3
VIADEFDFDRTQVLRKLGFPTRNLGTVQMTTDTAVKTTKRIVEEGIPFDSLDFIDRPEISASANEKLILNFRFLADAHGKPMIAPGIRDLLLADNDFDYALLE